MRHKEDTGEDLLFCAYCGTPMLESELVRSLGHEGAVFCSSTCLGLYNRHRETPIEMS